MFNRMWVNIKNKDIQIIQLKDFEKKNTYYTTHLQMLYNTFYCTKCFVVHTILDPNIGSYYYYNYYFI